MSRRDLFGLVFAPLAKSEEQKSEAPTLYMKFDAGLTLWMREVARRTSSAVWAFKEYKLWKETKKDWKEFEEFVDRCYKS